MPASRTNSLEMTARAEDDPAAEIERLVRRNADLERSNQDLERFAFVASHDLREPLRMITTCAQLLAKKYSDQLDDDTALFVGNIVDGARRMGELLTDLLAYAEPGSRREESAEAVDLNGVVEVAMRNLKASIDESQAIVTSDPLPLVYAHASDVISLFQNLLANAIKYRSERPPRIHISVHPDGSQLRFAVADNGIGIDPEHHREIFEPFKRLHGRNVPGTGLGLAICQRVMDQYGGRIWVESRAGDGATFLFEFPVGCIKSVVVP